MNTLPLSSTQKKALLGVFLADAAALGLHWLYDEQRLRSLAQEKEILFRDPDQAVYKDAFGYFAHGKKKSGALSHYGTNHQLMIRHLINNKGQFNIKTFQKEFRDYYGPGGDYVGFIDNPTRITLENLAQYDYQLVEQAKALSKGLSEDVAKVVIQKVLPYLKKFRGEELVTPVKNAIEITYTEPEVLQVALDMAKNLDQNYLATSGADDQQIPALSFVTALTFLSANPQNLDSTIKSAIRVTNHNDMAVQTGLFFSRLLQALSDGSELKAAITELKPELPQAILEKVDQALELSESNSNQELLAVAKTLGQTCYLKESLPLALYILLTSQSLEESLKRNVLAGGDSCGRSLVVGSIGALLHHKKKEPLWGWAPHLVLDPEIRAWLL